MIIHQLSLFAVYVGMYTTFATVSPAVSAQPIEAVAKFENAYLLSKSKEYYSYSQIFKKYQVVIFAKAEDCGQCISENTPWVQMIRMKGLLACFVVVNKSFRMAKYYYEAKSLPFDFYADTSSAAIKLIMDKNTPVVLMFHGAGGQVFFDNPSSDMKGFISVINSIDTPDSRK